MLIANAPDALAALWTGFALQASLIIALGAQNAFVLRQGLLRQHVGTVVLFCAAADALLMAAGVLGVGRALASAPALARAMTWFGAAFLVAYGVRALWRALRPGTLQAAAAHDGLTLGAVLAQAAAFTFLNPHVYLDTVLLFGTIGAQHPEASRIAFLAGGCAASTLWFALLGYGARALAPRLARPAAWRMLDVIVGLTMLVLAALLLR